jgi:hypothetical protein
MIAFSDKPPKNDWTPYKILKEIPERGELAGADIFAFQLDVRVSSRFANLEIRGESEQWDVDAKGLSHVYLFSKDILIQSQDRIHTLDAEIQALPDMSLIPVLRNNLTYASRIGNFKDLMSIGLTRISLSRKKQISLDFLIGYWLSHPHIEQDDFLKSLLISAHLDWDIVLIKQ